jgi:acyl carrier protein
MSENNQDVKRTVLGFMRERATLPDLPESEQLTVLYLDDGLIDSMTFVELIGTLEDDYGIRFEPEHLQSEEFRTLGGVVEVVNRLRAAG